MAKAKEGIVTFKSTKNRRRGKSPSRRGSKSLGPKSDMRGDKGKQ